jgi:hypothetical protein
MANCFKRLNALSLEDYTRLSTFFHKMYDFNPVTRVIDIELLLNEYENILLELGMLTRTGKSFENNILVNKAPAPPSIMKKAKSDERSAPVHLSAALQAIADKDAVDISLSKKLDKFSDKNFDKQCPKEKDLNPTTRQCVKNCNPGFSRNDNFKCTKNTKNTKNTKKAVSSHKQSKRTRTRSKYRY